jgi:isoquinoline 1-oxidoreductase
MKKDKYMNLDVGNMASPTHVNRREFLKHLSTLGGGIVVYFSLGNPATLAQPRPNFPPFKSSPDDFNTFLRIGADGSVTCLTGKIEMGQGIITSLAQTLADELDVPFNSVDMLMGDTDYCHWDLGTFGSLTTRFFGPILRQAAAEAKGVLLELAAEYLKTPPDRLKAKDGVIFDKTNTKNLVTYAQLTKGKIIERHLKKRPSLKAPSEFTIVGKPIPRPDALEKVTGEAQYAGDIRLPDMLYAKILRPPVHGATLKSIDTSAAQKMKGVQIVQDGDLIAVLHNYPDEADKALAKIKAQYDLPEAKVDDKTIFEHLLRAAPEGKTVSEGGNLKTGEQLTTHLFEETYLNGYVAHATIETHTAVAAIEGDKITIWASTQRPFAVQEEVSRVLGFPAQNVRVITPFVGGGFGGKGLNSTQGVEVARIVRKVEGKPVQLAWSRAEEFFYDYFRPAAVVKIKSGINVSGDMVLWDYDVYLAGENGSQQFYTIPHHRTVARGEWLFPPPGVHLFKVGPWRAPANNTNTFARESQIDIMASKAGIDPLEFRLNHLGNEKMLKVLKTVAEKFGWTPAKTPSNRGYGVACGIRSGTYVATMAEVEVDKKSGSVQVKRVVCAQDMGLVINPEGATMQMEGCITMGLGYALTEEMHFKGGEVYDLNFDTYEIPRFSWLPKIETVLIEAREDPPQGGGEPPIICMGAVIANAIYDAIGIRLFQLPMTPERIKEAIKHS